MTIATLTLTLFALRATGIDPQEPLWWTVGGLVTASVLAAGLAAWSSGRGFLYLAGGLLNLSTTIVWLDDPAGWFRGSSSTLPVVTILTLTLPVPAWLRLELRAIRPSRGLDARSGMPLFHRFAAWGAVAMLSLRVVLWVVGDATGGWDGPEIGLAWAATVSATALALGSGLWDDRSRGEVAGLYLLGLCAVGWPFAGFDLPRG